MPHRFADSRRARRSSTVVWLVALTIVGSSLFRAPVLASSSGEDQLALQARLDMTLPFSQTHWVGTHNSYNSDRWGYNHDPNQLLTLTQQLDSGVRQLVFDVHWYDTGFQQKMLLCHAGGNHVGCDITSDKTFRDGLDKIKDWLKDGHLDEVILLKVELALSGKKTKFKNQLEEKIGELLYRPDGDGIDLDPEDGSGEGCMGFPVRLVSKEDVLAAGKNLIVIQTDPDKNCTGNFGLDSAIYSGIWLGEGDLSGTGSTSPGEQSDYRDKFEKPSGASACLDSAATNGEAMLRQFDPNTWRKLAGPGNAKITTGNVDDYFACGLNIFELYNFKGKNIQVNGFDVDDGLSASDLSWSWRNSEPNYEWMEHCAFLTDEGLANFDCNQHMRFACRGYDGDWQVTASTGDWWTGFSACQSEFGASYRFSVPQNRPEADQLMDRHPVSGGWVWVAYNDLDVDGYWRANLPPQGITRTQTWGGGSSSAAFDDLEYLGLHRQWVTNVRKISMRSGNRIRNVSFLYNDGRYVSHGGGGGTYSEFWLSWGEYISTVDLCTDRADGSDRVFFLKFTTNTGRWFENGTYQGTCIHHRPQGKAIVGLFGRAGDKVSALGFYERSVASHYGWNHGEPNGGSAENCAFFDGKYYHDYACGNSLPFACHDGEGDWRVTEQTGQWDQGSAACHSEFGYAFGAPRTYEEFGSLDRERGILPRVWIRYSDRVSEGAWRFGI